MNRLSFFLVLSWFVTAAVAEEETPKPPTLYILRVFTIPKAEGLDLLAKDLDDHALYQHLMDQAKATPAVLEKLLLVASNNRQQVELQQANELRYPTEFDPQQISQQVAIGDGAIIRAIQKFFEPPPAPEPTPTPVPTPDPAAAPQKASADFKAEMRRHPVNSGLGNITSITPTAFEMRPLGERLILAPTEESATGDIAIDASFSSTRLAGFQTFNGEIQAQFSSRNLTTKLICRPNAPCFLGTCTSPQRTGAEFGTKEATVSLAFLTARSLPSTIKTIPGAPAKSPELTAFFEVVSLPKAEASALVEEALDDSAFHARLKASLKAGEARLETFLGGSITLGSLCTLAETDEYIYHTEYDPPQSPSSILIADDELLADLRAGRQVGTGVAPPQGGPHNGGFGLMTTATPMSSEIRKLGTQLEIEAIREGQIFSLSLKPQLSRLIGEEQYIGTTQPIFESQFLTTATNVRLGVPHLLGTLSRPINTGLKQGNQDDRISFTFITLRSSN